MISSLVFSGRIARTARSCLLAFGMALAGLALVAIPHAEARMGNGSSFGSRGSRTFSAPSATPTAPRTSSMERSATPNYNSGYSGSGASRPGFFGGGFGRGLVGGFLGAGLFGMLFGNGFGGGLGGGMSIIGLILQLGLLYFGFRFVMNLVRGRQTALGGFGGGASSYAGGGGLNNAGFGTGAAPRPQGTPITIGPDDYQAFERRLVESQAAYSNGDIATLRRVATPEMAGNFEQELAGNAQRGVVNKLADVRLLQGDLSEAWREAGSDYATVAMRFTLIDSTIDQRSGRLVSGDPNVPQTVTEVWTFARPASASPAAWSLSAIQQA